MKFSILVAGITIAATTVLAGEIETLGDWEAPCSYKFSGRVEPGDAAKIEALDTFGSVGASLCLDSPGGSLPEGIRMFNTIWDKQIHTRVMNGDTCESACAVAWLGGGTIQGTYDPEVVASRSIESGAVLGFHAPSLNLPKGGSYASEQVEKAFAIALTSAEGLFDIKLITKKANVDALNDFLYARILETPGDSMFRIGSVAEALMSNVLVIGVQAPEKILKSNLMHLCENTYLTHQGADVTLRDAAAHLSRLRDTAEAGERVVYVNKEKWVILMERRARDQFICVIGDEAIGLYLQQASSHNGPSQGLGDVSRFEPPTISVSLQTLNIGSSDRAAEEVRSEIARGDGYVQEVLEMPHYAFYDGMIALTELPRH